MQNNMIIIGDFNPPLYERTEHPERKSIKVYYQVCNRSPAQVGCMRQVLRVGALGSSGLK